MCDLTASGHEFVWWSLYVSVDIRRPWQLSSAIFLRSCWLW